VVLFDQRNCGRSLPPASDPTTDLGANTTANLLADIERLREHLGIERWLVLGGSWGSTLALVYAEAHPGRVSELVLFGVTTGRHSENDWMFRGGLAKFFPGEWSRLVDALPRDLRDGDTVAAYARLLNDADPDVRSRAAEAWCLWESATADWPPKPGLAERFSDRAFAYSFARLVTHYISHNCWLEDGPVFRDIDRISNIPGVLITGRYDFEAPLESAWSLHRAWPNSELVVVADAGHSGNAALWAEVVSATDRFRP
jgi:proline iminopeptidase